MKRVATKVINKIINLKKRKLSNSEIARKLEISLSTVKRYVKKIGINSKKSRGSRSKRLPSATKKTWAANIRKAISNS
jgi:orotate phosphoribosyltransferase-like protein